MLIARGHIAQVHFDIAPVPLLAAHIILNPNAQLETLTHLIIKIDTLLMKNQVLIVALVHQFVMKQLRFLTLRFLLRAPCLRDDAQLKLGACGLHPLCAHG